jgi:hypothetical protein
VTCTIPYRETARGHEPVCVEAGVIADAAAAVPAPASALARGSGYGQPHADLGRTSRLPFPLPLGAWQVRWGTPLGRSFGARWVLQAGARILVESDDGSWPRQWRLLDLDGRLLAKGAMSPTNLVLDPERALFYATKPTGSLAAIHLADGKLAFCTSLPFGQEHRRVLMVLREDRFVTVGVVDRVDPRMRGTMVSAVLEVHGLPEEVRLEGEVLLSVRRQATVYLDTHLLLAAGGELLVLACEDTLCLVD